MTSFSRPLKRPFVPVADLLEVTRNRLLRRVDWRFLLPNPSPARSICFAGGELRDAVTLISGSTADAGPNAGPNAHGEFDLAVALDPGPATLRASFEALRPGGSCYTEWYSRRIGAVRQIPRAFKAMGFAGVCCYRPWPSPHGCKVWLPLETPEAWTYYFRLDRWSSHGLRQQLRSALGNVRARLGLRLPLCVIGYKPETACDSSRAAIEAPSSTTGGPAEAGCDRFGLLHASRNERPAPGSTVRLAELSWLLLTGGPRTISKVVAVAFAERDVRPRFVVKMARVRESVPGLEREAATLKAVEALRPAGIPGVPRVLLRRDCGGLLAVSETVVIGRPLHAVLRRSNYCNLALKATDWLVDLATLRQPSPSASQRARIVEPALSDFADSFGPILDVGMVRETREILTTLGPLPVVCEQRDFSPWNVFLAPDGTLAVLDWESSECAGLPAMDLIYFLSYLALFLDGAMMSGGYRQSYRTGLDPSTFTGSVRQECLSRYASQTGIDRSVLRPLRLLVWVIHSRSEYRHYIADEGGTPKPETLRRSLFVQLWEEELRHGGAP